jgi:hypothetical protein
VRADGSVSPGRSPTPAGSRNSPSPASSASVARHRPQGCPTRCTTLGTRSHCVQHTHTHTHTHRQHRAVIGTPLHTRTAPCACAHAHATETRATSHVQGVVLAELQQQRRLLPSVVAPARHRGLVHDVFWRHDPGRVVRAPKACTRARQRSSDGCWRDARTVALLAAATHLCSAPTQWCPPSSTGPIHPPCRPGTMHTHETPAATPSATSNSGERHRHSSTHHAAWRKIRAHIAAAPVASLAGQRWVIWRRRRSIRGAV